MLWQETAAAAAAAGNHRHRHGARDCNSATAMDVMQKLQHVILDYCI
jgi:hypothetical protein